MDFVVNLYIYNCVIYVLKGHVYFSIRDYKTMHRDWSAIGSRLRQTFVVEESTIVRGEINIIWHDTSNYIAFQPYTSLYCIWVCLESKNVISCCFLHVFSHVFTFLKNMFFHFFKIAFLKHFFVHMFFAFFIWFSHVLHMFN